MSAPFLDFVQLHTVAVHCGLGNSEAMWSADEASVLLLQLSGTPFLFIYAVLRVNLLLTYLLTYLLEC